MKKLPAFNNLIFIGLLIILAIDNHPRPVENGRIAVQEMVEREKNLDSIFSQIPHGSLISYEPDNFSVPIPFYQLDAMILSQKYKLKTINAYTATCPRDYSGFWKHPDEKSRIYWLADKNLGCDSLYIIKNPKTLQIISLADELKKYGPQEKYQDMLKKTIQSIKNDKAWYETVKRNAIKKSVSLDSMLFETAVWQLNQTKKENESRSDN